MSALTGDAAPGIVLPCGEHIAITVGTLLAIIPSVFCGNNVAEFDDESDPEFEYRFVTEFVIGHVSDFLVRTGAVELTFV